MLSHDIQSYPELLEIERKILDREALTYIGRYSFGDEISQKIGNGSEIDGVRDYQPGDDARHIDWVDTAKRSDRQLSFRQHYEDQEPFTMIVSDVPSHLMYAETVGNPFSARTLGLLAVLFVARSAENIGSPIGAVLSDGFEVVSVKPEGKPKTAERVLQAGVALGEISTDRAVEFYKQANKRVGLSRKKQGLILPEQIPFSQTIEIGKNLSKRSADTSRFVVISDFRTDLDDTSQIMQKLKRTNDVVAIQITNPVMRGVLPGIDHYMDPLTGQTRMLETKAQKDYYTSTALERQQEIDEILSNSASTVITLDTTSPAEVRGLLA
jgi:uncharacterized protein (DUF58 family)